MRQSDHDDRSMFVPLLDQSGEVITMDEYNYLIDFVWNSSLREPEIKGACLAELARIRATGGPPSD